MERSLYSPNWHRVKDLRPQLRAHVGVHRQRYRGQLWYILQDRTSGRFHRFTPSAQYIISLMDGNHTVQEIWDQAGIALGEDVLTQDEMIRLLAQLHTSDVLFGDIPPDVAELHERGERLRKRKRFAMFMNPLAIRFPLFDPDKFLEALMPFIRPIFSAIGALILFGIVGCAFVLAGMYWDELTEDITDRVLATESLLLLLVTYPLVKTVHELGHGFAVKRWGGEVHEIGIMLLVFMPVPYVDASAASVYPEHGRRAIVGAAGIIVELLLASFALFGWISAEEGLFKAFLFNVMLIGGVSTLLFNGNPLLRFDGYYVLSDLLQIPNLATRANKYFGYVLQTKLYGVDHLDNPATAEGEPFWLFSYAIASFCYRLFIMVAIATFVANAFFFIGVLIAAWAVILMLGVPLFKHTKYLFVSPALNAVRSRALSLTGAIVACIAALLLFVPVPYATMAEGIIWTPGETVIHASAGGFVKEVPKDSVQRIAAGDTVITLEEPFLDAEVRIREARVRELRLRYEERDLTNLVEAKIVAEQLSQEMANLNLARQRQRDLRVNSPVDGQPIVPYAQDLEGTYLPKGELVGYTRTEDSVVRVIVDEDEAELVRDRTHKIELRLAESIERIVPASITREVPTLSGDLPSYALSTAGGGEIAIDPTDPGQLKVLANLLHLELRPEAPIPQVGLGSRVYVKFSHDPEPLGFRIYRTVRQVFLRQFSV